MATAKRTGVLLLQLGSPEAPTAKALRPYLREFLSDPRVIEPPPRWNHWPRLWRGVWWCVLNGIILIRRPGQSAARYQRVWSEDHGMPLIEYTRRQTSSLAAVLPDSVTVRFAMRYGRPGTEEIVEKMTADGTERLIVLPMYPQYSGSTTGSALDALHGALQRLRYVPAIRVVPPYYDHPAYIESMAGLIEAELARLEAPPQFYLLSYHGIPQLYVHRGDPYARHVERTTQALVRRLGWAKGTWARTYQSLFGKAAWLKPYTEEVLKGLAKRGIKRVFIATPGFTADCLETIDEIGYEAKEVFLQAGGEELIRCPCLNDSPSWISAMRRIVLEEGAGWIA